MIAGENSLGGVVRIDAEEVRRIADLAGLQLSDDEAGALREQLASVLDYVAVLDAVEPGPGIPEPRSPATLRPDRVREPVSRDAALDPAAEHADGLFRVPRVLPG